MCLEKIILGTVQLGVDYGINNHQGKPSKEKAFDILNKAYNNGICFLDTASAYGDSEQIIGEFHEILPESIFGVITKFHVSPKLKPKESIELAMNCLKVNEVDTLLFHSFSDYKKIRDTAVYDELLDQVGHNIRKLGVSVYSNHELEALENDSTVQVVQLPFNLLDNDATRGSILKDLKEKGKIIHTRSVFLQGLFFQDIRRLSPMLQPLRDYLNKIKAIAAEENIPIGALALQYVLSKEYIDGVLIGVESSEQLMQNIEWLSLHSRPDAFNRIDEIDVRNKSLLNPVNW